MKERLRGEVNTFRYVPLFLREFTLDVEERENGKIVVRKEGENTYTLVRTQSFPWWLFFPNFALCSVVLVVALLSFARTKALPELAVGGLIGTGMAVSLLSIDRVDSLLKTRAGKVVPLLRVDLIATPAVVGGFLLLYGAVFTLVFKTNLSPSWLTFAIEFFILTAFLYPLLRYWENRKRLFLVAEEEGFVVIARAIVKRREKEEGTSRKRDGQEAVSHSSLSSK